MLKNELKKALERSKDGQVYVVLRDSNSAVIIQGEEKAKKIAYLYSYQVYAKCKDGKIVT